MIERNHRRTETSFSTEMPSCAPRCAPMSKPSSMRTRSDACRSRPAPSRDWTGDLQRGAFYNGNGCGDYDVVAWTEAGVVGLAYELGWGPIEQLDLSVDCGDRRPGRRARGRAGPSRRAGARARAGRRHARGGENAWGEAGGRRLLAARRSRRGHAVRRPDGRRRRPAGRVGRAPRRSARRGLCDPERRRAGVAERARTRARPSTRSWTRWSTARWLAPRSSRPTSSRRSFPPRPTRSDCLALSACFRRWASPGPARPRSPSRRRERVATPSCGHDSLRRRAPGRPQKRPAREPRRASRGRWLDGRERAAGGRGAGARGTCPWTPKGRGSAPGSGDGGERASARRRRRPGVRALFPHSLLREAAYEMLTPADRETGRRLGPSGWSGAASRIRSCWRSTSSEVDCRCARASTAPAPRTGE